MNPRPPSRRMILLILSLFVVIFVVVIIVLRIHSMDSRLNYRDLSNPIPGHVEDVSSPCVILYYTKFYSWDWMGRKNYTGNVGDMTNHSNSPDSHE